MEIFAIIRMESIGVFWWRMPRGYCRNERLWHVIRPKIRTDVRGCQHRGVENRLIRMIKAYKQLVETSESLLALDSLVWTENLLVKIVRRLSSIWFDQLAAVLSIN